MDDIAKGNSIDIGRTDINTVPGFSGSSEVGSTPLTGDWTRDRDWWRSSFQNRPYATADRRFEDYEPGYRFGYESTNRYRGRDWNDVEPNLRTDWDRYEHRGSSTWENVKDSVRDAWDNLTGKR
jgi:hypothetical protein